MTEAGRYESPEAMARRRARAAHMRFFGGVHAKEPTRCELTLPLFPLWLILDADGTLPDDLRQLVERTQA